MGGKGEVEATRAAYTYENSTSQQYHLSGGISEINATTKDLKYAGIFDSHHSTHLFSLHRKHTDPREKQWIVVNLTTW